MDVVLAGLVLEGRIHLLDVKLAVEMLGVAVVARSTGLLPVLLVTGEATQSLVDAGSGAVVA